MLAETALCVCKTDVSMATPCSVYTIGLLHYAPANCPVYLIDPADVNASFSKGVTHIKKGASEGMKELYKILKIED